VIEIFSAWKGERTGEEKKRADVNLKKKGRVLKNNLRAIRSYRKRRTDLDGLPTYLFIEPTNLCNLHCIMCPTGAGKVHVEQGYMDVRLFRAIVDEVHPYVSTIILAMGGESLLHPDLADMIRYAEGHEVKVELNTNATLLNGRKARELLRSGISYISFAFDGYDKAGYERVRRGADFEATRQNILNFLRLKKEAGAKKPFTVLSMLDFGLETGRSEEMDLFLRPFRGLLDDVHIREVNSWGCLFKGTADFSPKVFAGKPHPCGRLWNSLAIAWNGEVLPCVFNLNHDFPVGRISERPLSAIWNSERLVGLRRAMCDGRHLEISPLCENCTIAGTPAILGVPAGLRASLADSLYNFTGYRFERTLISLAGRWRKGHFASRRIRFS
jgi:radical SAM protein with 4Fe4S-binding SPASM domain